MPAVSASPSAPASAVPHERRRRLVPRLRCLLEPSADLGRRLRMLSAQRTALEDALDGFSHVQPTATKRGVERHDAVPAQPDHHVGGFVAGQIVPHEQEAQWRQLFGQGEAPRQALLPDLPGCPVRHRVDRRGAGRQGGRDRAQAFPQPAMQHGVRAVRHRPEAHLAGCRFKQGQHLARPPPHILVRHACRRLTQLPTAARTRHGLERTGLVFAPDRQPQRRAERVGPLDQPLFATAS